MQRNEKGQFVKGVKPIYIAPTNTERIGETRTMNNGLVATIVAYRAYKDIDIMFECGVPFNSRRYEHFINGTISCPMKIVINGDIAHVSNPNIKDDSTFICDVEDLDIIRKGLWTTDELGYVISTRFGKFHRLVMNAPKGVFVDHKNHNCSDNRKSNLRLCSPRQNKYNSRMRSDNVSGKYKGVTQNRRCISYSANITANGENIFIGSYSTPEAAALAYNEAALKYHGEFARLNDI